MTAPVAAPLPVGQVDLNPPLSPDVFPQIFLGNTGLSDTQRATVYSYVAARTGETVQQVQDKVASLSAVNGASADSTLSSIYIGLVKGLKSINTGGAPGSDLPTPSVPNPLSDFLKIFENAALWTRIGEFSLGFLLIGIAVAAGVKATGVKTPKISPIGSAAKLVRSKPSTQIPKEKPVIRSQYESRHAPSRIKPGTSFSPRHSSVL